MMHNAAALSFDASAEGLAVNFWSRAAAFAIDLALLAALHLGYAIILAGAIIRSFPLALGSLLLLTMTYMVVFLVAPLLLALAYFTVLHARGGQTVGKIIMGLRVLDQQGGPLPLGAAFLRTVSYLVSALPFGAGFLWAVLDREGRAWHDHLAGSRVAAGS